MVKISEVLEKKGYSINGADQKDSGFVKVRLDSIVERDESLESESDIVESCDVYRLSNKLISLYEPESLGAKQIDLLRTEVLYGASEVTPRVIMITGTARKEGCSLLVANLAITISKATDKFVLIVDANLINPVMHDIFHISQRPGLYNYLEGEVGIPEIIKRTGIPKLSVIPSGIIKKQNREIISTQRMLELMIELKDRYEDRYIILDSPALLISDDAKKISKYTDKIVYNILSGGVIRDQVLRCISLLPTEKISGIVINDKGRIVWDAPYISDMVIDG